MVPCGAEAGEAVVWKEGVPQLGCYLWVVGVELFVTTGKGAGLCDDAS